MSNKMRALGFVGELAAWLFSNTLCLAAPLLGVYAYGTQVAHWGPSKLGFFMVLTAIVTSTWGSWGTLIWTRSRGLRAVQQAVTTLPGITLLVFGGILFYVGMGKWYVGAILAAAGLGNILAAVMLAGGVFTKNSTPTRLQYALGLLLFPLATTGAAGAVAALWYGFVSEPTATVGTLKQLFTLATLGVTIMAMALTSTIIPAAMSRACQQLSATWASRPRY